MNKVDTSKDTRLKGSVTSDSYTHRTLCSILDDSRKINKTLKASLATITKTVSHISASSYELAVQAGNQLLVLDSLVEEIQVYANRMEAALEYQNDLFRAKKEYGAVKDSLKSLYKDFPGLKERICKPNRWEE